MAPLRPSDERPTRDDGLASVVEAPAPPAPPSWVERILGPRSVGLETRMVAAYTFALGAAAAAGTVLNVVFAPEQIVFTAAAAFVELTLWYLIRVRRVPLRPVLPAFVVSSTAFVVVYWFGFAGSAGPGPFAVSVLALLPVVLTSPRFRLVAVAGAVLLGLALYGAESVWPGLVRDPYPSPAARRIDAALTWAFALGITASVVLAFSRAYHDALGELAEERRRSEALLLNVMPELIAARLKGGADRIADRLDEVTILFVDVAGFTDTAARLPPRDLVYRLDQLFTAFDAICARHGVEKIKTMGDAYMAAAGVPVPRPDHAIAAAAAAIEMLEHVDANPGLLPGNGIRVGLHSGPVVAGVLGASRLAYDLWGDAVNTASRMESHGVVGRIHVSESTHARIAGAFELEPRGTIEVKGKGSLPTWFLVRRRAA